MLKSNIIHIKDDINLFFCLINNNKYILISKKNCQNSFFILIHNTIKCNKIDKDLCLSVENTKINSTKIISLEYLIKKSINSLDKSFIKQLVLKGRGFKSNILNNRFLQLKIGLSHLVKLEIPKNIKVSLKKNKISCKSTQILAVNNFSTQIKKLKKKDVYKGKGILLQTEIVKLKPIKKK